MNSDLVQKMDNAYEMQKGILKQLYEDRYKVLLPASLTSWSRYYLHKNKESNF